jgi:signal peptidase II
MTALFVTVFIVLVSDQALKLLIRYFIGSNVQSLGALGSVQIVEGRLWIQQARWHLNYLTICTFWAAAAVMLVIASTWIALSPVSVGLLLGGSISNAIENSIRGSVSDYVCLQFWPAFNFADLALSGGAIGTLTALLTAVWATVS